jgi:hypothetical protein
MGLDARPALLTPTLAPLLAMLLTLAPLPVQAQLFGLGRRPPPPPPVAAEAAPPPPPDPAEWWKDTEPKAPEAKDPLGDRRASRSEAAAPARDLGNGVEPLLYRLWGLQPLQLQLVRGGEAVIEAWVRPSGGVRQAVIRVTVRRDGRSFVQARAGFGCCRPEILRRVDIDQELPAGAGEPFLALAQDAVWSQPAEVIAAEKGVGAVESVCVNGVSYDLTLLTAGSARHLRRNCDSVEIGSIAGALSPVIAAALGRDPLFDYLFPRGADFSAQAQAYDGFIAAGGRLTARKR